MKWIAEAPSNIALIKYMGKTDHSGNLPCNASLSWSLDDLKTQVEIEWDKGGAGDDAWEPLVSDSGDEITLTAKGRERFLEHFSFLKKQVYSFDGDGRFIIRSANNFPADCGLASSASSFAALTKGAALALSTLTKTENPSIPTLTDWSRRGSGSSCRSFYSPWALWKGAEVSCLDLPARDLLHMVVITEEKAKLISSSEAHRRVTSSDLFLGRVERAENRLQGLLGAIEANQWKKAYQIIWAEFWDMHALFETANEPFGYMNAESMEVLSKLRSHWAEHGDGPWVTMDAGPNVHLLFRKDQAAMLDTLTRDWSSRYKMIKCGQKRGAWNRQ